jgi:hypothetical protein
LLPPLASSTNVRLERLPELIHKVEPLCLEGHHELLWIAIATDLARLFRQ